MIKTEAVAAAEAEAVSYFASSEMIFNAVGADRIECDWLARWARYSPDKVALESADEASAAYTYADMYRIASRLAMELRQRFGIQRGDRIALLANNELETHFLFFAAQRLGAMLVPLNFRLTAPELEYILCDAEPALLIRQRAFDAVVGAITPSALPAREWAFDGEASLLEFLAQIAADGNPAPPEGATEFAGDFNDPCLILYTSGTTGRPKGALVTNKTLFWNSVNTGLRLQLTTADATVSFLPLFHTGGWNVLTTPLFHHGGRVIFLRKFDPEAVLRVSVAKRATILFGVPTTLARMVETAAFAELSPENIRFVLSGGEAMPLGLIESWQARGIPVRQGFGLTEFGPNVFSLNAEDSVRKIGSIGLPNFYIDVRVVEESGADVARSEAGELLLRGPGCMPGYWRNPAATREAIRDGWLHTGDIVRRDADGFFYVVDRKKDMYISGGENVYPLEVEHCLRAHPGIAEAAVIGIADAQWGESGKAFIVARAGFTLTAADVLGFCQGRLARYKIPKQVEFLSALPKGDSGKILKRALRSITAPAPAECTASRGDNTAPRMLP